MDKTDEKSDAVKKPIEKLKSADKQARLAEALRNNLRRRKQQARDRKSSDTE